MFFKLILENANGDRVDMTTTANQYMTSKVEGLNPPTGTIQSRKKSMCYTHIVIRHKNSPELLKTNSSGEHYFGIIS
jgi:hypothetical protein